MPFGRLKGRIGRKTNRWYPAKTAKDRQQDTKIRRLSRRIANAEVKTYTQAFYNMQSNVTVSATVAVPGTSDTSVIFPITVNLTQGTGGSQRLGVTISVQGISLRLLIYDPTTAGISTIGDYVRVLLVYDRRFAGTYLTKNFLLENSSVTDGHYDDINSDYDIDNVDTKQEPRGKNVTILWDRTVVFGRNFVATASASASTDKSVQHLVYNKKFKVPKIVNYSTLGGPQQLYFVCMSGPSNTTSRCPVVHATSTVYFTDI